MADSEHTAEQAAGPVAGPAAGPVAERGAEDPAGRGGAGRFPSTEWTLVRAAGSGDTQERRAALSALLVRYLPVLRGFLLDHRRVGRDDVDDLLQDFIADRVIGHRLFAHAERRRGRFRAFLLVSLGHFAIDWLRRRGAAKRSPHPHPHRAAGDTSPAAPPPAPAFDLADLPSHEPDPPEQVTRAWARQVVAEATRRMRTRCDSRPELWLVFEARLLRPATDGSAPDPYAHLAGGRGRGDGDGDGREHGTAKNLANLLITAKRTYATILRGVVGEYAAPEEVDDEIRDLQAALGRGGR